MTLDPVHVEGIAALARHIRHDVDETDHRGLAERVWADFLDPLSDDGDPVLEPIGEQARYCADVETLGLQESAFDTVHGLDSGTVNERVFRNGLTIDVAQAAMSVTPTDLGVQRSRTIVTGVHTNDATVTLTGDWQTGDDGHARLRVLEVPDVGARERAVHWLTLYHAESEHALRHADDVDDLLVLDGPLYPKELVNWAGTGGLAALVADEERVESVVDNYVSLVEQFLDRGVPLVGFVKGARSHALLRALDGSLPTPWADDVALFTHLLERREDGERVTSELSWTNWFVSRLGADGAFGRDGDPGVDRSRDPSDYEVAFFVVFDPRRDLTFRVELPLGFARDPDVREAVQRHVLTGVAAAEGPPPAVAKADEMARVGPAEAQSLVRELETAFDSRADRSYDDERWGDFR
ncbi:MAG: DNA double-strand break repair nuclease NurA [Halobacteriaceae archaeon]